MTLSLDIHAGMNFSSIKGRLEEISSMDPPAFVTHRPDFQGIRKAVSKHKHMKKLIVAGNGGSINNFIALAGCLHSFQSTKTYHPLTTPEPDHLRDVQSLCPRSSSLVMPVSKSGTNVCPIEIMLWFMRLGYNILPVTGRGGALAEIARRKGMEYINHPDVGGRFAGGTSCAFAPAAFLGIPVERVSRGMLSMYRKTNPDRGVDSNPALQLSAMLFLLSGRGYTTAFMPVYSTRLSSFIPLITQLVHESISKHGKGLTLLGGTGPEIQHHSTQRFFGGRKDMLGILVNLERFSDEKTSVRVPEELQDIPIRNGTLGNLGKTRYSDSVRYDFSAVRKHALKKKIPHAILSVNRITPETAGEFMAFWQYVAVYTSLLFGVNPFDQPEVEFAKRVSFDMRKH